MSDRETELLGRIRRETGKRSGQPIIRDLRITVTDVRSWIEDGMTDEEILSDFPMLEVEDLDAVRLYVARGPDEGAAA